MTTQAVAAPATILVVEDDPAVRLSIRLACEKEGFDVTEATSGAEALEILKTRRFSLVLLDLMLPEVSGLDVFRAIRQDDPDGPVIMVTAKDDEIDRIVGLELGADDYVTKPFSPRELIARVRAVLRRTQAARAAAIAQPDTSTQQFRDLVISIDRREVTVRGKPVSLTKTEFDILAALIRTPGRVLTRDQLVSTVWGYDGEGSTRLLDSHIGHLRQKIERDPSRPRYIVTVRDVGYKFSAE